MRLLALALPLLCSVPALAADVAYTKPVGGMKITIAAGTGTTRTTTVFSVPLWMEANLSGAGIGQISSLTSNTISNSTANWTAGEISNATVPCFLQITSGSASGRMFLVSSGTPNTATTLTIDPSENVDLTTLGISSGDTYKIYAADTLALLLPGNSGVLAGATAATADNLLLNVGGIWRTFFYSSTNSRWTQVALGSPNASNTLIGPAAAVQFSRLAATPLTLTVLGTVPSGARRVTIANSGVSFVATGWPVSTTLGATGLQNISGWRKSTSSASADTVQLLLNGIWRKYYHDGTNWRQIALGSPISDSQTVAAGTGYLIYRAAGSGSVTFTDSSPYTL